MADPILGLNRDEIVESILDTVGRPGDTTLQTRLNRDINFAQLAFWKLRDWKFAYKNGLTDNVKFPLQAGVTSYVMNTATVGFEIRNTDVDKIYIIDPAHQRTLDKVSSRDIRAADPGRQSTGDPTVYAPYKHNGIDVWPIPDDSLAGVDVYIDAKVLPSWISLGSDYPSVPIEYQETFMQYFLYRTLSRERDPRQEKELIIFKDMLKTDTEHDLREIENNLHIRLGDEYIDGSNYPGMANILKSFDNGFK